MNKQTANWMPDVEFAMTPALKIPYKTGNRQLKTNNCFTLVELLVVIAIISILASILLPALQRAKQQSHAIVCIGKLKQMSLAYISYIDDNNGYLAPLGVYPKNFGANPNIADGNFYGILMPYLNDNRKGDYTLLLGIVQPPSQYPKYVQFCPSNSNLPNIVSNSAYPSYGFNKWAVITQFPAKYSQLTSISKTIYLYDGIKTSSNSGGASISGDIPLSSTSNSAPCWYAHPGGANFAFMDGHASFVSVKQSNDTDWYAWRLSGGWKYLW